MSSASLGVNLPSFFKLPYRFFPILSWFVPCKVFQPFCAVISDCEVRGLVASPVVDIIHCPFVFRSPSGEVAQRGNVTLRNCIELPNLDVHRPVVRIWAVVYDFP